MPWDYSKMFKNTMGYFLNHINHQKPIYGLVWICLMSDGWVLMSMDELGWVWKRMN